MPAAQGRPLAVRVDDADRRRGSSPGSPRGRIPNGRRRGTRSGCRSAIPAARSRSIAVVHEVTESVVRASRRRPVDLVVTYHPLLFRPAARLVAGPQPGRAARSGCCVPASAVVVTHSDFDVMPGGMSDAMADALGLTDVIGFAPVAVADQVKVVTFVPSTGRRADRRALARPAPDASATTSSARSRSTASGRFVAGSVDLAGRRCRRRGRTPSPRSASRWSLHGHGGSGGRRAAARRTPTRSRRSTSYPVESNQLAGGRVGTFDGTWDELLDAVNERSRPMASGSRPSPASRRDGSPCRRARASRAIAPAATAGCDVLVSGDISHHRMVEATDRGLSVIDAGHAATERPGMRRLQSLVTELAGDSVEVAPIA